jgi:carotenoid cleavage dioxygenase
MEVSRRSVIGAAGAGAAGVFLSHVPGHHAAWTMGAPFPTDDPHLQGGHAPVWDELTVEDLPVRGELPREIAGVYMRNGPNPAFPPISYTWPFDGDGMVHALHLADGRAAYRNRFVLTAGLRAERRAGRALYGGLARPVPPDPALVGPDGDPGPFKNVANTNVVRHAGRTLALWEAGLPYELTRDLETLGVHDFAGRVQGAFTAHPKLDPVTGEMLVFRYGPRAPHLLYTAVDASGAVTRQVPIETPVPVMVHDFAATPAHVVFVLCPVVIDGEAAKRGGPVLAWRPELGTRIAVLRRDGTEAPRWFHTDPFFLFHIMNAHEEDGAGRIAVDYVQHGAFMAPGAAPCLWRLTLDLAGGGAARRQLDDRIGEFPRVDPARAGLRNRYGWLPVRGGASGGHGGGFGALARYDFATGAVAVRDFGPGREVDEPVFVPRPGAVEEGDGWVMAYVYERASDGSVCVLLDARDIGGVPVAEIVMPRRVPHGFHGNWMPA